MPETNNDERLLSTKEAARYLNVSPGTMAVWRCVGRYDLKWLKIGRSIRYRPSELESFLEQQLQP